MQFRSLFMACALFGAAIFTGSAAQAQQAEATTTLNVRSGPGTNYRVVDVLRTGQNVNILRCTGSWCQIQYAGPTGWASASYLRRVDTRGPRPGPGPGRAEPDVNFCIEGPNFRFGVNCDVDDRRRPGFPGRPGPGRTVAEVCFYEHFNYGGDSFCVEPGDSNRRLSGRWNDTISSIRVRGRATATVCENFNFGGRCANVNSSIPRLSPRDNDIISSYRVR